MHKHHTYYQINRNGDILLKEVTPENYFRLIGPEVIGSLCHIEAISDFPDIKEKLMEFNLLDQDSKITELGVEVLKYGRSKQKVRC